MMHVLVCAAALALAWPAPSRQVAVTFDDLPLQTRRRVGDVVEQQRILERLLGAVRAHKVPAIGFVNENKLAPGGRVEPRRVRLLEQWVDAGLELGNHSYSHLDLHQAPLETFMADVARGDSVTRRLLTNAGRPEPRWFRHPFLHTGRDTILRARVEGFLANRGYRVAPVTMDNYDYLFAAAYERALDDGDASLRRRIVADYLAYMTAIVAYHEQQSVALFAREIPQVLLLHSNQLNADTFDALARMLENRGYSFVPLDSAVSDSAYRSRDTYVGPAGITWLHRWALTLGKRGAFFAGEPSVPDYVERAASGR